MILLPQTRSGPIEPNGPLCLMRVWASRFPEGNAGLLSSRCLWTIEKQNSDDRTWTCAPMSQRSVSEAGQRLVQIADEILGRFETDREPHHVGSRTGGKALLVAQLAMGGGGGMQDQASCIADIGEMREQADRF